MIAHRRPRWAVLFALVPVLAGSGVQPLRADSEGATEDEAPADARIERLHEAIERERDALERERETRRSMEEELGRMRDELDRTREELERLERETEPGTAAGE